MPMTHKCYLSASIRKSTDSLDFFSGYIIDINLILHLFDGVGGPHLALGLRSFIEAADTVSFNQLMVHPLFFAMK